MTQTKEDIAEAMSEATGITKQVAKEALKVGLDAIITANEHGERVKLIGFGSFYPVSRPAYRGINPATMQIMERPSKTVPKFKPGSAYRDRLKSSKLRK